MAPFEVDWSELPMELLGSVLQRLSNVDIIRFGALGTSWYSAASDKSYSSAPQLPWLMLPYKVGHEGKETRKFCHALLMNPFSGAIIHLPPTETFPDVLSVNRSKPSGEIDSYTIRRREPDREYSISAARLRVALMSKAIVTADPLIDDNYMVGAIGFSGLAFCKPGADSWTQLDRTNLRNSFEDVLYFNGLLYVLHRRGDIVAWDVIDLPLNESTKVAHPCRMFLLRPPQPIANWFVRKRYLVESSGDLLQVLLWFREKWGRHNVFDSASCSVCRFDQSSNTWV
ncbi:uncharacterized protein LOC122639060 [Telopea speciosissima]|uniref:uncharacterized protein LOC122639060 n=1 Tax=Telopea speciosissima TaxID=54955 RepID=UPI001CC6D308|nr:uncharacterized protein LOC122639060 [Telopea speciosissima]